MQITFAGPDGQSITVADTRAGRVTSIDLPEDRRPVAAILATMQVLPEDRRPAAWIAGQMKV